MLLIFIPSRSAEMSGIFTQTQILTFTVFRDKECMLIILESH